MYLRLSNHLKINYTLNIYLSLISLKDKMVFKLFKIDHISNFIININDIILIITLIIHYHSYLYLFSLSII